MGVSKKIEELKTFYPYDPERQFFELWRFNDPNIPDDLDKLKYWCQHGLQRLPKKPWTEYLKEIGAYNLSEDLIVKAMKNYFEEHNRYPAVLSGDASKYIGIKITWSGIDKCLRDGFRGLPGGSSLSKLRQEHLTGIETGLTEDLIVKAMKDYFEDHANHPSDKSGDASKYIGFKITWRAVDARLREGGRGLPRGSSLSKLRQEHLTGIETFLTEDLIVQAMKDYHEEHSKHPSVKSGDASKCFGFKITWASVNDCLRRGNRGLPGKSSLAILKKKHNLT